jgi:hypothetical protein
MYNFTLKNIAITNYKCRSLRVSKRYKEFGILLTFLLIIYCSDLYSQSEWLDYGPGNSVSIEIYKPFIPRDTFATSNGYVKPGYSPGSLAYFLTGRYAISKEFTLVAEIPFAYGKYNDDIYIQNGGKFEFANPYFGAEYNLPRSPVKAEFGSEYLLSQKITL